MIKIKLEQLERLRSEIPPAAPWLPILVIHIRSQVKKTQSQSYKFKKIAKISNFEILQKTLQATHLLKLFYKMYKYEMDPTRTVEATERTRDAGRTRDGRTDRRTDGVKPIYPPPPPPPPHTHTHTHNNNVLLNLTTCCHERIAMIISKTYIYQQSYLMVAMANINFGLHPQQEYKETNSCTPINVPVWNQSYRHQISLTLHDLF